MKETVLCYIENNGCYLLLLRNKKEIDINKGKYIGIGGHIELGENKEEALIREVKEETGLIVESYQYRAKLIFINNGYKEIMYLFTVDKFTGEVKECDEGELHWIRKEDIFKFPHWEGDEIFIKKMLDTNEYFDLTLIYKDDRLVEVIE